MSTRLEKFEQLHKSLKKHFKFVEGATERTVLEHLLYACCLEDARSEQADEAFAKLQQTYFDWNEVRVTTVIELSDVLSSLPNATAAGHRIKRCLQSLFETRYQFDIEDMKKANLGKATEEIQAWPGMTTFVLNYTVQHALGGHSIPVDGMAAEALWSAGILTDSELDKKVIPGIERAVAKNKGFEFASLLHQFGVEFGLNRKNALALAVFKDLGVTPKAKVVPPPPTPVESKAKAEKKAETTSKGKPAPVVAPSKEEPKPDAKGAATSKKPSGPPPSKNDKADVKAATSKAASPTKEETPPKPPKGKESPAAKPTEKPKDTTKSKDSKDVAKPSTQKLPPAKPAETKQKASAKPAKSDKAPAAGKSAPKPKSTSGKEPAKEKAKPSKKAEKADKKPEPKKAAPTAKKPTKMANNVKITKKKPK